MNLYDGLIIMFDLSWATIGCKIMTFLQIHDIIRSIRNHLSEGRGQQKSQIIPVYIPMNYMGMGQNPGTPVVHIKLAGIYGCE
jgi:hypothetical protein